MSSAELQKAPDAETDSCAPKKNRLARALQAVLDFIDRELEAWWEDIRKVATGIPMLD